MLTDIEIAQKAKLKPIVEIAHSVGIPEDELEFYGKYKAKVQLSLLERLKDRPDAKLIYTTAITATAAGEGKTCIAAGITQALGKMGKKVVLALREPSLGPTFGIKGGAAGGGYSQVVPMEDINLHFTGDIHAVGAAHNLLAALVDNHIIKGNELGIDPTRVLWRRSIDISDRQLRSIVVGLGGKSNGFPRETGFDITAASEVMAVLCLSTGMADLKERLSRLLVAYTFDGKPVYAKDVKAVGSMAVLLKDALKPNLIQTLEGQPVFMHGGPFANIAQGNNTVLATRMALKLGDYAVTEGGFAADLGAEKFFDIICRQFGMNPDVVILVASVRALNMHGGATKDKMTQKNLDVLAKGCANLDKHVENVMKFGLPVVVALNRFPTDSDEELEFLTKHCGDIGVKAAVADVVARGGEGGLELARTVLSVLGTEKPSFRVLYPLDIPIKKKIETLATEIYGAEGVVYTDTAERDIKVLTEQGKDKLPLCMAKTQLSLTDNPDVKGAPRNWKLTVREVRCSSGAGFLVPITGPIMLMPGLPKVPAAEAVDIFEDGTIVGLF